MLNTCDDLLDDLIAHTEHNQLNHVNLTNINKLTSNLPQENLVSQEKMHRLLINILLACAKDKLLEHPKISLITKQPHLFKYLLNLQNYLLNPSTQQLFSLIILLRKNFSGYPLFNMLSQLKQAILLEDNRSLIMLYLHSCFDCFTDYLSNQYNLIILHLNLSKYNLSAGELIELLTWHKGLANNKFLPSIIINLPHSDLTTKLLYACLESAKAYHSANCIFFYNIPPLNSFNLSLPELITVFSHHSERQHCLQQHLEYLLTNQLFIYSQSNIIELIKFMLSEQVFISLQAFSLPEHIIANILIDHLSQQQQCTNITWVYEQLNLLNNSHLILQVFLQIVKFYPDNFFDINKIEFKFISNTPQQMIIAAWQNYDHPTNYDFRQLTSALQKHILPKIATIYCNHNPTIFNLIFASLITRAITKKPIDEFKAIKLMRFGAWITYCILKILAYSDANPWFSAHLKLSPHILDVIQNIAYNSSTNIKYHLTDSLLNFYNDYNNLRLTKERIFDSHKKNFLLVLLTNFFQNSNLVTNAVEAIVANPQTDYTNNDYFITFTRCAHELLNYQGLSCDSKLYLLKCMTAKTTIPEKRKLFITINALAITNYLQYFNIPNDQLLNTNSHLYQLNSLLQLTISKLFDIPTNITDYYYQPNIANQYLPGLILIYYQKIQQLPLVDKLLVGRAFNDYINLILTKQAAAYYQIRYQNHYNQHLHNIFTKAPELKTTWHIGDEEDFHALTGNSETRNWKILDTDNYWLMFTAGTHTKDIAQNIYGNPNNNKCLVGYLLNGDYRMIVVKNQHQLIVAKCMLNLLDVADENQPVLFMEQIYPINIGNHIKQAIEQFAISRAKRLGLSLLTIESTQKSNTHPKPLIRHPGAPLYIANDADLSSKLYGNFTINNAQQLYQSPKLSIS